MKKSIIAVLLVLLSQSSLAADVGQLRSRNEALEAYLLELRLEQARAMLAGESQNLAWRSKMTQLQGLIIDINTYTAGGQLQNRAIAIDASQQLVKDLATKYVKKVYGSKMPARESDDPLLEAFAQIFKALKLLETRPNKYAVIYPKLQEKMAEFEQLITSG